MYWQNTKKLRYFFALVSIIVVASLVNIVGFGSNQVSALTSQQCYDQFNGVAVGWLKITHPQDMTVLEGCKSSGDCTAGPGTTPGELITCTRPNPMDAASAAAAEAVMVPLTKAVCGTAPSLINQTGTYLTCKNKVYKDYQACAYTGGGVTSNALDTSTNTAKCFVAKGNKISVAAARTAIEEGRAAGDAITTKAAEANRALDCAASGKVIVDGKCVTNPAKEPVATCTIDGIGWIVCPVVKLMANVADASFGFLANNFLSTNPKIFDSANPTFSAWSVMRNLANVAFVIAFLIIIFSQLTSVGITNYGVKKMLPRLVIAAILVNISYFVCQIAVDLSNILGFSVKSLLEGLGAQATSANTSGAASSWATGGGGFVGVSGKILALGGAAIILYALLATLVPVLLAAVVALIMILFILVARQALIILLIVISPLAFVAYLLPNTEQWFKKWQKAFTAMLLLFPIVAVVFGMSSLASQILTSVNTTGGKGLIDGGFSGEANTMFGQIVAAAIMVLPLFVVPGLLKKALDGVGGIGAKINGIGGKLGGMLGKKGSQGYENSRVGQFKKFRAANYARNRALVQSGHYEGKGIRGWASGKNKAFNESKISGKFGDRSAAAGWQTVEKEENEDVERAMGLLTKESSPTNLPVDAKAAFIAATQSGDTTKARAAQKILLTQLGAPGIRMAHEAIKEIGASGDAATIKELRNDINSAGLKGKDNVLATWGYTDTTIGALESDTDTFSGLNPTELAGQHLKNLEGAAGLTGDQARSVLSNQNAAQLLSGEKREFFEKLSRNQPSAGGAPLSPTPEGNNDQRRTADDFERMEAEELNRRRNNPS